MRAFNQWFFKKIELGSRNESSRQTSTEDNSSKRLFIAPCLLSYQTPSKLPNTSPIYIPPTYHELKQKHPSNIMKLGWGDCIKKRLRFALYVCLVIVFLVVFDALLNPVETDEVSPAYWNTSAYDAFDEITAMGLSKSESESERFLVLDDDDRHDNGPNEQDATNGPTVLGYTKIPSSRPSVQPSPSPTSMPTSFPTSSPSGKPSGKHE